MLTLEELERQHISKAVELARWTVRGEQGATKKLEDETHDPSG